MSERIHQAVSAEGIQIAGRVRGHGRPLVFVHGGLSDGERGWEHLLPLLDHSFTCYLPSTRGRGLSHEPPDGDYALERLVQDVVAFVESIGQPVGLVGHSLGGALALGAAAASAAVSRVAVYEPAVFEAISEVDPRSEGKAARIGKAMADGNTADAARLMVEGAVTDDELAALEASGIFDDWALNVRVALQEAQQAGQSDRPTPTDASSLRRIAVPVLFLRGSQTPTTWYLEGARHVADHVVDCEVLEIAGAGHLAPQLAPELIAGEILRFFGATPQPR
jgi:pimeloyl-ACP methyl ester carboxylesterase